jgi:catalase
MKSYSFHYRARLVFLTLASAAATPMPALGAPTSGADVNAPQMIEAFEGTFGVHPGQRRNHTKGLCAAGDFVGTADAAALSRSCTVFGQKRAGSRALFARRRQP